jgi:nicotinamidase-related amidase
MAGSVIRDPAGDHLLTPQNASLFVVDYQPSQIAAVRSMDRDLLLENIVSTVKTAKAFGLPIIHSTINVATGRGKPTVPELAELLSDNPPIDRTTTNAWEDAEFVAAVRATGRRKLIACALWTEICMTFPALDALREGYDVYPVVDAIGGTSARGAPRRTGAGDPSGRPSGRLGRACRRAPARLGSRRNGG